MVSGERRVAVAVAVGSWLMVHSSWLEGVKMSSGSSSSAVAETVADEEQVAIGFMAHGRRE